MMYGKARTRRRLHGHSISAQKPLHVGAPPIERRLTWRVFARPVFPHAPVGLVYVTQRFEVGTAAQPFSREAFKQGICREIDAAWRAADLVIDVTGSSPRDGMVVDVLVSVKVRTASRLPDTPTTEATAEDIERLFAGFASDPARTSVALGVDIHAAHAAQTAVGRFGDAAIQAAFDAVRITFVGPKGQRSNLERAALRIPDLRLRPEVLYNFLALRAALHGDEKPPPIESVRELLKQHDVRTKLIERAHSVESDELERAVAPSDVASVRACARPEAHLDDGDVGDGAVDDTMHTADATRGGTAPMMEFCGCVPYAEQGMAAVIAGIDAAIDRNHGWRLRLTPCTEAQRAQLRAVCHDADRVSFYVMQYEEETNTLSAYIVLRGARRATWWTSRIEGSRLADWTPMVLSAEARHHLREQYSEGVDRGEDAGRREGGSTGTGSEGGWTADSEQRSDVATDGSVPMSHSSSTRGKPPLVYERAAHPLDDYGCAAKALYDVWWPLFPLRRGLEPGKPLSRDKYRHVFLYFDGRFAHDMPLLFTSADAVQRHAVNSSVGVCVKTNAEAFAAYQKLVTDDEFLDKLDAARRAPNGKAAREVTATLLRIVTLTGRAIPWGSQERAAEVPSFRVVIIPPAA